MNIGKFFNYAIATILFTGLLAATLPGFFNPEMSPFQAFVVAPALTMLAAMISAAAHHVLELGGQRMHRPRKTGLKPTDGCKTRPTQNLGCGRIGPDSNNTGGLNQDTEHGQRAA